MDSNGFGKIYGGIYGFIWMYMGTRTNNVCGF